MLLFAGAPVGAVEFIPLFKLDLLGGQFFFQDAHTSFSGNTNLLLSPSVKLNDRDTLVPTISSQYRRTREVRELLGGGFLTQESLDNLVGVKWIRQLDERWALKPNVSFKSELITETSDETLGKGLFDYNKLSAGLEAERRTERLNLRHGLSAYRVRFPHYHALSASSDLGAEIRSGDRVLDFNAYDYSLGADFLWRPDTVLTANFLLSARPFTDQKLVTRNGTYQESDRFDVYGVAAAGVQQKLPAWGVWERRVENLAGMNLSYTRLGSNQDNYDATRTRFNPAYYDYWEIGVGPYYAAKVGKALGVTVAYDYTRREYTERLAQAVSGDYTGSRIRMNTHTFSAQLLYPLWRGVSVKLQGSYRMADSNMRYEQTYRYNYRAAHYFAGLSYSL